MSKVSEPHRQSAFYGTVRKYLPDLIYGANDGVVTTLAVVAGVIGAALSTTVILILGFANLLADGFSMGASNVLSRRSEAKNEKLPSLGAAAKHGIATLAGFVVAGVVPLLAYLLPWFGDCHFPVAGAMALLTLFVVGASRAFFTERTWLWAGVEMLLIGALAAGVAYGVGALVAALVGGVMGPTL
jgi:vacuolar iron transporter family protein